MAQRYYSVDEVADLLGLHVRTVRGYVRDGRLRAARIGKQYRISREDLEAFTGSPAEESAGRERHAEVSAIVQIEAVTSAEAQRITAALTATLSGRGDAGAPLRVQTAHDAARDSLKIVILGGLGDTASLLRITEALAAEPR